MERVAWDQRAPTAVELKQYSYVAYLDGVRHPLLDAVCAGSPRATIVECSAGLPQMAPGLHRLEIATVGVPGTGAGESAGSLPVYVLLQPGTAGSTSVGVSTRVVAFNNGTGGMVEVLASGLNSPSALAVAPDGQVFLVGAAGNLQIWNSGSGLSNPAMVFDDVATGADGGLIDLVLHPRFTDNHQVFFAYTARLPDGSFVNRVVRGRETNGAFGDIAVLLEDSATNVSESGPRIRFGPDGKLYVAFGSAGDPRAATDASSYNGKILRLNADGTTPDDNPGYSPIISSGHRSPVAYDWQPETGRLWIAERDWSDREQLVTVEKVQQSTGLNFSVQYSLKPRFDFKSPLEPVAALFFTNGPTAGLLNRLLIAAGEGRYLLRLKFDPADPTRVIETERVLDRQFGRIRDLVVGPDGAIYLVTHDRETNRPSGTVDRLVRIR